MQKTRGGPRCKKKKKKKKLPGVTRKEPHYKKGREKDQGQPVKVGGLEAKTTPEERTRVSKA